MPHLAEILKRIIERVPKHNIEKFIFEALLGVWVIVVIIIIILRIVLGTRYNIEREMITAATNVKMSGTAESKMQDYESLLNLAKNPEGIEEYTGDIKRDPFMKHEEGRIIRPAGAATHDFTLKSIERVPLPIVYKGYIELPDTIIGQIALHGTTKFVKIGAAIEGYRIHYISREKMEAIDKKGEKIEFALNKPVFSDALQAVLYDNISQRTYYVQVANSIDDYKIIDIGPNYVILQSQGVDIRIEK